MERCEAGRPVSCNVTLAGGSEEFAKLLGRESRIPYDPAHRERVHRIVARDSEDARAVGHHRVLPLADDPEARLLERADRVEVVDAGDLAHGLDRDLNLAHLSLAAQ